MGQATSAQRIAEESLPVEGHLDAATDTVTLGWPGAKRQIMGSVTVSRRRLGREGPSSWEPLGSPEATAVWRDTDVVPGRAFEYQVVRRQREIVDAGYWIAGHDLPARSENGTAIVLVDEDIAPDITMHLNRFRRDLVGAGWTVVSQTVPRHLELSAANFEAAIEIRDRIARQVAENPDGDHAVVLIGHVPILHSGQSAPDGHAARPHPTDAFYADLDGNWTVGLGGVLRNDVVPGNGIELQIGRIDFGPISAGNRDREIRLLEQYFDKNHHWRHGRLGDLRTAYASGNRLSVEADGLLNLVDADDVAVGGHHDLGRDGSWLWGVDFGPAKFEDYFKDTRGGPVFAINFGSHKQMFDGRSNAMSAMLAHPWHTVAVGWGARPAWRLHRMALGGTIGEVHRITLNNGAPDSAYPLGFDYFPMGQYVFRQPVWVNLLGDPTLGAYPLAPPVDPVLHPDGRVSWQPSDSAETRGYRVYRLTEGDTRAEPVGDLASVARLDAQLGDVPPGAHHVVRRYGLKETPAGSFFTYSQGSAILPSDRPMPESVIVEGSASGDGIFIPARHRLEGRDFLVSIVQPPRSGRIASVPGGWSYVPADVGPDLLLPISIFDGRASRSATLEIRLD